MNNQEVIERLEILISLLLPKFGEEKYPVKGLGVEIMRLADADHTVEDIMKKVKKSRPVIDNTISKLRSMGLIKSISKNGKTYYIRLV
jgi:DNA-binding transcriptional ArsR family regulator